MLTDESKTMNDNRDLKGKVLNAEKKWIIHNEQWGSLGEQMSARFNVSRVHPYS